LADLSHQEDEQEYRRAYRGWALQQLHENITVHFGRAAGFGVMRMGVISPDRIDLEPRDPLKAPMPIDLSSSNPSEQDLYPIHRDMVMNFVAAERMGYVRSRSSVAGFESHGFSSLHASGCGCDLEPDVWQIARLELVSILRHEPPRTYTADSLPSMEKLDEAPHRALDDFETRSLPKLAATTNLVVDQQPERIRMLGALRADKSCLDCHDGARGTLLGAMSYELTPIANATQQAN
jgi:hypothetical protein